MNSGYLTAADTLLYADSLAAVFRGVITSLPTVNALAATAKVKILGDGGSNAGISNADVKAAIKGNLPALVNAYDLTRVWAAQSVLMSALDTQIRQSLPGWNFTGNVAALHFVDAHLTRLNAGAGAPVTGSANPVAGTLTAANNSLGALPACTSGNAPRVVHTLVGAADYYESLPSGEATQVALSGSNNSYSYQIAGTVPTGVTKVRIYRGLVGGATSLYYWMKDVVVTAGSAYPAIPLLEADAVLRQDLTPPAWLSGIVTPEFAGAFALAFSGSSQTSNLFTTATTNAPVVMTALAMLSPGNVALNPTNMFLGVGNPQSSGRFGVSTITAANTQTWAGGAIQAVNNPAANVQGFSGALALQSRVITALSAGATVALSYTYYDATHGWGVANVQTQTGATAVHATGAVGETIPITVTAGRVVQSVTVTGVSGAATSGAVVIEAAPARTIGGPIGSGALNN